MKAVNSPRLPVDNYWTPTRILREFHRDRKGFLALYQRRAYEDGLRPVFSMRARKLKGVRKFNASMWFRMGVDGYFKPLAYYKHGDSSAAKYPFGPAYRKQRGLKSLNTCFVDIDFYDIGRSFESTLRRIGKLVSKKKIPKPSMIADSGSGIWLFWLLHYENDTAAPPKGDPRFDQS